MYIYLIENGQFRTLGNNSIIVILSTNSISTCSPVDRLYVTSCELTKDLGVTRVDERIVDVVTRSHRRLAPATRHSIMLRSQSARWFFWPSRQKDKLSRFIARNSRKTKLASKCDVYLWAMCRGAHKQRPRRTTEIYYTL